MIVQFVDVWGLWSSLIFKVYNSTFSHLISKSCFVWFFFSCTGNICRIYCHVVLLGWFVCFQMHSMPLSCHLGTGCLIGYRWPKIRKSKYATWNATSIIFNTRWCFLNFTCWFLLNSWYYLMRAYNPVVMSFLPLVKFHKLFERLSCKM